MGLEGPGSIEASQVTQIVNAILEYALLKCPQIESGRISLVKKKIFLVQDHND